jgi:PHP-associated
VADDLCADGAVDVVEAFNAKMHDGRHNIAAAELAARHGLPVIAGSDAHDVTGLGAAYLEMPDFDGPSEFLTGLARARIVGELRPHAPRFPAVTSRTNVTSVR